MRKVKMPNDMTEEELDNLLMNDKPFQVVDFPGLFIEDEKGNKVPVEVGLVTLTVQEEEALRLSANRRLSKLDKDGGLYEHNKEDVFNMEYGKELVFRCCKKPNDKSRPFFYSVEQVGKLSNDQLSILINNINTLRVLYSPIPMLNTPEELEEYVSQLAKAETRSFYFLDSLSLAGLKALILHLVKQSTLLQKEKS